MDHLWEKQYCIVILLLIVSSEVLTDMQLERDRREPSVQYEINSGGAITLEDVEIFSEEDVILFPLPPSPAEWKTFDTTPGCKGEYCATVKKIAHINQKTHDLRNLLRKSMTRKGQRAVNIEGLRFMEEDFDIGDEEYRHALVASGSDIGVQISAVLNNTRLSKREKRMALVPFVLKAGALVGPTLLDSMTNLFTTKKAFMKSLIKSVTLGSSAVKPFLKIAKSVSEFVATEENDAVELRSDWDKIKTGFRNATLDHHFLPSWVVIFELMLQGSITSHQNLLFSAHLNAVSECRANELPLAFVSPQMLEKRLLEIEAELDPTLELLWNSQQLMKYYKSDGAECSYFENGGILSLRVPLKLKSTNFVLYKFQGLSFTRGNHTCDFQLPTMHIIKDEMTNLVYPVSNIDDLDCSVKGLRTCKVPNINAVESPHFMCVRAILREATVQELRNVCQQNCRLDSSILPVQVSDNSVVVTNLPKKGAHVLCGKVKHEVNNSFGIGALHITMQCNCKLVNEGIVLASSKSKICSKKLMDHPFSVKVLVPAQWTKLDTWRARPHDATTGLTFTSIEAYLRKEKLNSRENSPVGWFSAQLEKMSWLTTTWQLIQSILSAYFMYRLQGFNGLIAHFSAQLPNARAECESDCIFPMHIELLIYGMFCLLILLIFPSYIRIFYKCVNRKWDNAVDRAADRRLDRNERNAADSK